MELQIQDNEKFVQSLVLEHNKLRQDPKSYVEVIKKHLNYFIDDFVYKLPDEEIKIKTIEGKKAYLECIDFLSKQEPLCSLDIAEGLCKSSESHVLDLGAKGITGHVGTDESTPVIRIERFVKWGVTCCENISFGPNVSEQIVVGLIVDDNVADRGHRTNIFNKDLKFLGANLGFHNEFRHMCVINYAGEIIEDSMKGKYFIKNETIQKNTINATKNNNSISTTTKRKKLTDTEKRVKYEDFFGKMKTIRETGKMLLEEEDYKKLDNHLPTGAVSVMIKRLTYKENGKIMKKIIKTYLRLDGTKHLVEYIDKS